MFGRWCFQVGDDEQNAQGKIGEGEEQVAGIGVVLQYENEDGWSVGKFFDHGRNHHGTKTSWISGDDAESDLPGECESDEAVIEAGVRDGRRILAADEIKHEVQGNNYKETPDACDPENDFGEFHGTPPRLKTALTQSLSKFRVEICARKFSENG
jgi:hypothetical protein